MVHLYKKFSDVKYAGNLGTLVFVLSSHKEC